MVIAHVRRTDQIQLYTVTKPKPITLHHSTSFGRRQVLNATIAKDRMGNARAAPERRVPQAPTAIYLGGIAETPTRDGARQSTADTLQRG